MSELKKVIGDYPTFLDTILAKVANAGFDLADFIQIDHMCYRTVSAENYTQKKSEFEAVANLLGETTINGRPISTFRLNKPVLHHPWRIDAVELPAPKVRAEHKEGFHNAMYEI